MVYLHNKHYSVIKRNELLIHATTWMNLKNSVLSEKGDTKDYILYDPTYIKFPENANL